VLTIAIQRTSGTHGNFGMVLPVRSCGGVGVVARCQGRPPKTLIAGVSNLLVKNENNKRFYDDTFVKTHCNVPVCSQTAGRSQCARVRYCARRVNGLYGMKRHGNAPGTDYFLMSCALASALCGGRESASWLILEDRRCSEIRHHLWHTRCE